MEPSVIDELRLTAFKSFRDAVLPLGDLSLLVGRNGSGKSNALDGLWALARLAEGEDIRDALDGGREGPAVRGGAAGCAPFGESAFALGCTIRTGGTRVDLDVRVQVEPDVQVVHERNEQHVESIVTSACELDDVMLTLLEGQESHPVPARIMSDGTLRFLAILTALLQTPTLDLAPEPLASDDTAGEIAIVIEELEVTIWTLERELGANA